MRSQLRPHCTPRRRRLVLRERIRRADARDAARTTPGRRLRCGVITISRREDRPTVALGQRRTRWWRWTTPLAKRCSSTSSRSRETPSGRARGPAADDDRVEEEVDVVDETGGERVGGEGRAADGDVAVGGLHQRAHRVGIEGPLEARARRGRPPAGSSSTRPCRSHATAARSRAPRAARPTCPTSPRPPSSRTCGARRGRCRSVVRGR